MKKTCFLIIALCLAAGSPTHEGRAGAGSVETGRDGIPHLEQINPDEAVSFDPAVFLNQDNSAFRDISFPQEGMIVSEKANLYDYSFVKIGEYAQGDIIPLTGLHDVYAGRGDGVFYEFFYRVADGKGLVKTRDVIPTSVYENPQYISTNGTVRVINNPISTYTESVSSTVYTTVAWYHLWLKRSDHNLVFLAQFSPYCIYGEPISFSPNQQFMFLNWHGKLYNPDGSLAWASDKHYTSPIWHEEKLFLRGVGEDDAVYLLDLKRKKLEKLLDISDGERIHDNAGDCLMEWQPIQIQDGIIKTIFIRTSSDPPDYRKPCMIIEVISDMEGNVTSKDINWDLCD